MAKAKTKGTNAKIKELKGEKPSNISSDDLEKIQDVVNGLNRAQMEIGSIESRKHSLLHHVHSLQEDLGKVQKEIKEVYGTDDVNIHDGTINYPKENGEVNKKD